MRVFTKSLMVLALVAWAGMASAGSVDLTVITPGHVDSVSIYGASDVVTMEVSLTELNVNNYWATVQWESNISLTGVVAGSAWMPNFGFTEYWSHLGNNLTVDAEGLRLNGYDPGGKFNFQDFNGEVLGTLIFHLIDNGDGNAIVNTAFAAGDGVFDSSYAQIPGVVLNSVTLHTPEPTTAVLMGLGMLGIAYAGRRR